MGDSPLRQDQVINDFCIDGAERKWQGCTMRIDVKASYCSTCCCKDGLYNAHLTSELLFGDVKECNAWFVSSDQFARIILSFSRANLMIRQFTEPCWRSKGTNR